MAIVTTDSKHYKNIANAFRKWIGTIKQYKPEEMEAAVMDTYGAGYTKGESDGVEIGKGIERDLFWDVFQNYGNRDSYPSTFRTAVWTDEIYHPKYPILAGDGSTYMYQNALITNTLVPITFSGNGNSAFAYTTNLHTIPLLKFDGVTNCTQMFQRASSLANVTFAGTWDLTGLNLSFSPLTVESILSLFATLADYSASGGTYTLTLGTTNLKKLTDEQKAIATEKGWTLV